MTIEEILAMKPGNELDALIGKEIMEWTPEEIEVNMLSSPHHFSWSPSTDISDTNKVFDKLKEEWNRISLIWDVDTWDIHLEDYEECLVSEHKGHFGSSQLIRTTKREFYLGKVAGETYEELSVAICKAALLTKCSGT